MKKMLLAAVCLVFVVTSIGCSTIKGIGEDISAIGGWVSTGSDNVKNK